MYANILNGKAIRDEIFISLKKRINNLKKLGCIPGLATILVGNNKNSKAYVEGKHDDCKKIGINSIRYELPSNIKQNQLHEVIDHLNIDADCTGYILQLPLPKHLNVIAALERIKTNKDVDGLNLLNLGKLVLNQKAILPCTPCGIVYLLKRFNILISGMYIVIIGRGITVGRPMGLLLTSRSENATVSLCHTGTKDISSLTRQADIIVSAAGVPYIIKANMIKKGATVLNVGFSWKNGQLVGDIAPSVLKVASYISPKFGGIGVMTRAFLMYNVIRLEESKLLQL